MKLLWTDQARIDFAEQLDYIAEDNPSAALRIELEIENQIDLLNEFPNIGRAGRVAGTQELVIRRTTLSGCISPQARFH